MHDYWFPFFFISLLLFHPPLICVSFCIHSENAGSIKFSLIEYFTNANGAGNSFIFIMDSFISFFFYSLIGWRWWAYFRKMLEVNASKINFNFSERIGTYSQTHKIYIQSCIISWKISWVVFVKDLIHHTWPSNRICFFFFFFSSLYLSEVGTRIRYTYIEKCFQQKWKSIKKWAKNSNGWNKRSDKERCIFFFFIICNRYWFDIFFREIQIVRTTV